METEYTFTPAGERLAVVWSLSGAQYDLDDQLKREAGMLFEGENLKPVPELPQTMQVVDNMLAWRVLENENVRQREISNECAKRARNAQRLKSCWKRGRNGKV
jgi:hypothetical protein